MNMSLADQPRPEEPDWPAPDGQPVLFLLDAASALEDGLLRGWIERHRPEGATFDVIETPSTRRRRRRGKLDPRLEDALATGADPLLAPLRVVWLARKKRGGRRMARVSDLLRLRDPRDPGRLQEHWVARREPERCRIVAGQPAPASELRQRWRDAGGADAAQTLGLPEFVSRQAALALERAERQLRGARYKVPRFVADDLVSRPAFRGGLARLARQQGRDEARVLRQARRYLGEIAATHSPFVIDLVTQLWRRLFTRGYRELRYDPAELEGIRYLAQRHPLVFLPTHKSNLDHPVLQYMLHEEGLPPNHTAGGINMNFFPLGPLVRRSGIFFIRRTFKDNEVYKFVLHQYIDYLVEKRFSMEWYIEGGRSRSGKLLPPRFGLLAYVVDSYRRGKSDDVLLLPISIAYDQISDVGDYASEARGGAKERESFRWFLGFIRRLRRQYGNVEIRFGEPVSLQKAIGQPDPDADPNPDESSLALQKLAFETCVRINRVTPITPTSLVSLGLLGRSDRALSVPEMRNALANLLAYVERRELPTTEPGALESAEGVRRTLDRLVANGVLTCFSEGPEPVYAIGPNQHLSVAYYRNTVIHFFVNGAIAELALLRIAESEEQDLREPFWDEVMALRDLLKFEFFFAEKDVFVSEIRRELALHEPSWEARLQRGSEAVQALYPRLRPFHSHRILRPFLEAYRVVGDVLERRKPDQDFDEKRLLDECLALGKQYSLQRYIRSEESVSKVLFKNALRLAGNRGLLKPGPGDLAERRRAFAEEIRQAIRRVDAVEALVSARRAGLMD
jgi:glycerol-3-phosphate O-acyltransferase